MTIAHSLPARIRLVLPVVAAALVFAVPAAPAQSITLTPLQPGFIYAVGEKLGWSVTAPVGTVTGPVTYTLRKNGLSAGYKTDTLDLSSGSATIETTLDEPGSVLVEVRAPAPVPANPLTIANLTARLSLTTGQLATISPLLDELTRAQKDVDEKQASATRLRAALNDRLGPILTDAQKPQAVQFARAVSPPARGGARGGAAILSGALVAPQKLTPSSPRPADFDLWWEAKIRQLHEIPVNAQLTVVDSGKPTVDYAKITMDNIKGAHIQGQLAKPAGAGKHPALLILQWAGGTYSLPPSRVVDRAAEGWLALNIEPHDIAFDQPQAYYTGLNRGPLGNFQSIGQEDRETSYFLAIYLSAYRALDYLTSRDDWDGKTLVVQGNSMGGQQSLAMAGLYPKITAVIAEIPSSIDVTGPEHGSAAGFPDWARDAKAKNNPKILETGRYFDPMNFAAHITVPALVAMGAYDETSPPVGIWRALNLMKGPVEPLIMNSGHPEVTVSGVNNHSPYKARLQEWFNALVKDGHPPATGAAKP